MLQDEETSILPESIATKLFTASVLVNRQDGALSNESPVQYVSKTFLDKENLKVRAAVSV